MAYYNPRSDVQSTDPSALNPDNHRGQTGTGPGGGIDWTDPRHEEAYDRSHPTGTPAYPKAAAPPGAQGSGAGGLPDYQAQYDFITNLLSGAGNRTAPQSTSVAPVGLSQAAGATLGPAQQAQLAAAAQAQQARASLAGPAAQAADSSFRGGQQTTADYLTRLMQGQDSAAGVQAKMQGSQLLAQQAALAASARPGMGGAAQRMAAQNQSNMGAQLESATLAAQLQERAAAASQLNALLGTARGQDLQNNEFNADQTNQTGRLNAQLGTQTGIANAGFGTQAGIANMQAGNQLNQFNSGQINQQAYNSAQLGQQNNQYNAGLAQQNNQYNAGLAQQNNQYNAGAQLQQSGQNDQFTNNLLGQRLGLQGFQQQGQQFQQSLAQQRALAMLQNDTQLTLGGKQTYQQLLGGLGGAANMLLPYLMGNGGGGGGGSGGGGLLAGLGDYSGSGDQSFQDYLNSLNLDWGDGGGGDFFGGDFMNGYGGSASAQLPSGYTRSSTGGINRSDYMNMGAGNGGGGGASVGGFAKGAAGGAAMGTAILPGWGTAIGAGIGGLMSLF